MKNFTHSSQIQKVSIPLQTYHSTNLILGLITNFIVMQGKGSFLHILLFNKTLPFEYLVSMLKFH